jgi:hypothetical protein
VWFVNFLTISKGLKMPKQIGKSAYADRLNNMKGGFKDAARQAAIMGGDETYPKGIYVGKVTAKLKESSKGNLMVSRMFVPTEGELRGLPCFDNLVIEHENANVEMRNMRTLCRFLDMTGYEFDTDQTDTLEPILEELTKQAPIVKFEVKHSGAKDDGTPFVNIEVLEVVSAGEGGGDDAGADAPVEESVGAGADPTPSQTPPLADFCDAHDIPYNEGEDDDILKARIEQAGPFEQDKLTAEEVELLVAYELGDSVEKPEPKPVAPPPSARRKPVAPPPPPARKVAAPAPKGKASAKAPARRR